MCDVCRALLFSENINFVRVLIFAFYGLYFLGKTVFLQFKWVQLHTMVLFRPLCQLLQVIHYHRIIIKLFQVSCMQLGQSRKTVSLVIISLMRLSGDDSFLIA